MRVIFRKRCITRANSGPDRSFSALSKKNSYGHQKPREESGADDSDAEKDVE